MLALHFARCDAVCSVRFEKALIQQFAPPQIKKVMLWIQRIDLDDAGEAIMNLELVAALPRPDGFFDPLNPAELPSSRMRRDDDAAAGEDSDATENDENQRTPLMSFSNTDMAFAGDVLIAGPGARAPNWPAPCERASRRWRW